MARSAAPRRSDLVDEVSGPWVEVIEDLARVTNAREQLAYAENHYFVEGRSRVRPGFALFDNNGVALPVQGCGHATSRAGTVLNWIVRGGRLHVGVDEAPTTEVDLATGGFTLDAAAERVYGDTIANQLILSDGVNRPRKVDLATLAVTNIAQFAEPAFGPPRVYYDKLFLVRAEKRTEMQWSLEGDPDHGYVGLCIEPGASGNYDNAWELRQTDQDALVALVPSNQALAYIRAQGVGLVTGPVTDEFRTSGQHDAVSTTLGSRSPAATLLLDDGYLWFIDQLGRPTRAQMGMGSPRDLAGPKVSIRPQLAVETLPRVLMAYDAELRLVFIAHPLSAESGWPTSLLVFSGGGDEASARPRYQGRWTLPAGVEARAMGTWRLADSANTETLVIGDQLGRAWGMLPPVPITHADVTSADGATEAPFTRFVRAAPSSYRPATPKLYDLAQVQVANPEGQAFAGPVEVSYLTPSRASTPVAATPRGGIAGPGADSPAFAAIGIAAYGSTIQLAASTSGDDDGYDLVALGVKGQVDGEQHEGSY